MVKKNYSYIIYIIFLIQVLFFNFYDIYSNPISKTSKEKEINTQITIAIVNLEYILKNFKKYPLIKKQLEEKKLQINILKKSKETAILNLIKNIIKKDDPNFNQNILKNQLLEIENKKSQFAQWLNQENSKLKNLSHRLKSSLLKEILLTIEKLRVKKNISLIFHKNALIAFNKKLEITKEVLNILNR